MDRSSASPRRRAGFSLVEMMVVLVVMGILMTMATPNFLSIGRRDSVQSAAYDLQRGLTVARQKALARRALYRVVVDPAGHRYFIEHRISGSWVAEPADPVTWSSDVQLVVSAGGSASNYDIVLEPQGTLLADDAPAHFTFSNAHGDTAWVNLVRTGRMRVRPS